MKSIRNTAWVMVAFALLAFGWLLYVNASRAPLVSNDLFKIGGSFSMTDQDGKFVSDKSYAGTPMVLFFGFTTCPDVCPTTLMRLSSLMKELGSDADKLKFILVSVDPERDTASILKSYLSSFDSRIIGLTGTPEQLADFASNYRFFYKKIPTADGNYTMDHSASVYLYKASGLFQGTIDLKESDEVAIKKLRLLLEL